MSQTILASEPGGVLEQVCLLGPSLCVLTREHEGVRDARANRPGLDHDSVLVRRGASGLSHLKVRVDRGLVHYPKNKS